MIQSEVPVKGARILVVEDESLIRLILTETLSDAGFDVVEAADGEEAIALLSRRETYDLLVTDVQMPGRFNGIAVASHALKRLPDLSIVFATGRPDSVRTAFGPLRERDACVRKPYGPAEMLAVICRLLAPGSYQTDLPESLSWVGELRAHTLAETDARRSSGRAAGVAEFPAGPTTTTVPVARERLKPTSNGQGPIDIELRDGTRVRVNADSSVAALQRVTSAVRQ